MTSDISVSVIIPVYNAAPYLRQCLDSVVNQTLRDIEIICVDDGSTDGSLDILREYERADGRVRVITSGTGEAREPMGCGHARNTGFDLARGEYVYHCDADDFLEPDALEAFLRCTRKTDADVVLCGSFIYYHETGITEKYVDALNLAYLPDREVFSGIDAADGLFQSVEGYVWDKFFRRAFILKTGLRFPTGKYTLEDLPFTFAALAFAHRITVLNRNLYYFRRFADGRNTTKQGDKHRPSRWYEALCTLRQSLTDRGVYDAFRRSFANRALNLLLHTLSATALISREVFDQYWRRLRGIEFADMGIIGHPREYFTNSWQYAWLMRVMTSEPDGNSCLDAAICGTDNPSFPLSRVPRGSAIVLYGAGGVGKRYYEGLADTGYCDVALWVDRRAKELGSLVSEVPEIAKVKYDHVVVAVSNPDVAREIGDDLVSNYGVAPERLVYVCE